MPCGWCPDDNDGFCIHADWREGEWGPTSVELYWRRFLSDWSARNCCSRQAEMGRSLTADEDSFLPASPVLCAMALRRETSFVCQTIGARDRTDILMAMAAQMLLHSVRHQHQVEHILANAGSAACLEPAAGGAVHARCADRTRQLPVF